MIAYLEGRLLKKEADRILLLVNHVGYEILVPAFALETIGARPGDENIPLYIYYHQTERQPKPVLIGFNNEEEREFFELFISVEAIGPLKAVKALTIPISDIARAIESKNIALLRKLSGIGDRTANKIIATLHGRTGNFCLTGMPGETGLDKDNVPTPDENFADQVIDVLVSQLGHRLPEAKEMVSSALKRKPLISSPEDLFDEIYRGQIYDGQNPES